MPGLRRQGSLLYQLTKAKLLLPVCERGGDVIAFAQFVDGCDFVEACRQLSCEPPPKVEPPVTPRTNIKHDREVDAEKRNQRLAGKTWREIILITGTPGMVHLKSRGLWPLPHDVDGVALGFHPRCPDGSDFSPAIVELLRDIRTNEPRAIRRTFLTSSGIKVGKAKALGPQGGTACKLSAQEEVTNGLTVGEGLETVLAGMLFELRPAWALGSAGELGAFPALAGIECLAILVDNDRSGTGQQRSMECSLRWTAAGREVIRVTPFATGSDINDLIRGNAA